MRNEEFDDEEFLARKIDEKNKELTTLKLRILGTFWNENGVFFNFFAWGNKEVSSVVREHAFNLSGNIISKLRARLNDGTIDYLCFEKSYFLKEHFISTTSKDIYVFATQFATR